MAHRGDCWIRRRSCKDWKSYTDALKDSNVKIREEDDQLLWSVNLSGTYVPNLGYRTLAEEGLVGQPNW